jgi:hypothetical protein
MMDRDTASKNIRLGLALGIFVALLFIGSFIVAEVVVHA